MTKTESLQLDSRLSMTVTLAWMFGLATVGALIGAIVGRSTENPNEYWPGLDPCIGALIGFPIGGVVGLLLFAVWALSRRPAPPPR